MPERSRNWATAATGAVAVVFMACGAYLTALDWQIRSRERNLASEVAIARDQTAATAALVAALRDEIVALKGEVAALKETAGARRADR